MKQILKPSGRLSLCAEMVREGSRLADIGTDHGYLPIELCRSGKCPSALACDVNPLPLQSAQENITKYGLSDRIQTRLSDGLKAVLPDEADDIVIAGMGGETVAAILQAAPWLQSSHLRLILQPMSHAEILRRWLSENGFAILGETLTYEDQYYQTIHARFHGETYCLTEEEAFFGEKILEGDSPLLEGYLKKRAETLNTVIAGKKKGKADVALESRLLDAIKTRLARKGERIE